jgi:hypothetical protein
LEVLMAKYFFHLRDGVDHLLDPEGLEMPESAIIGAALMQARDCMAGDVQSGRLDLHCHIDVHAEDGELVHSLLFADALEIVPASSPSEMKAVAGRRS